MSSQAIAKSDSVDMMFILSSYTYSVLLVGQYLSEHSFRVPFYLVQENRICGST